MSELARNQEPLDRDGIIAAIRATPIAAMTVTAARAAALNRYGSDPQTTVEQHQRSLQRSRRINTIAYSLAAAGLVMFLGGVIAAIILGVIGISESTLLEILIATGAMTVVAAFGIEILTVPAENDQYGMGFLQKHQRRYMPAIERTVSPEGVTVSLSDDTRTFTERTFAPGEITAALEYQVELETVLDEVCEERRQEFAQACLDKTTLAQTVEPAQKSLPPVDVISEEVRELEAILAEQEQVVVSR